MTISSNSLGFTLVEMGLVVAIMTIIATTLIKQQTQEVRMLTAKAQGEQLKVVRDGLYSYAIRNFTAVVNDTPVAGIADTQAPTVAELSALNFIPGGLTNNAYYGANYALTANPSPAACVMPDCNILVEAHLTAPIIDPFSGNVDGPAVGEIIRTVGADGGASFNVPGTISGLNGAWNVANPMGAVAGIVMARAGVGTQMDIAAYLRRDGTLPMTGNLDMGSQTIYNIQVAVQGGACVNTGEVASDADGSVLSCQSGTWQPQGSAYWKDPVNTAAMLPACVAADAGQSRVVMVPTVGTGPRAYTCNGSTWQALAQDDNGNMTIAETLNAELVSTGQAQLNTVVTPGTGCSPIGKIARDSVGAVLSCRSGIWSYLGAGIGEGQSWRAVSRGLNAYYYNTTGRAIMIAPTVYCYGTGNYWKYSYMYINGSVVGQFNVLDLGSGDANIDVHAQTFIVPNGHWYMLYSGGGCSIWQWAELR